MSIEQRAAVVREARSWIGTPYHNCADVKGHGVDCGMLLVRVFCDLKLCPQFDPRPYPPDWHLHRSEERYLGFVFDRAQEVAAPLFSIARSPGDAESAAAQAAKSGERAGAVGDRAMAVKPGDVAVFKFGRCYSHGGIVVETDPLAIVHAYAPSRCVVEDRLAQCAALASRAPRFFSYWATR